MRHFYEEPLEPLEPFDQTLRLNALGDRQTAVAQDEAKFSEGGYQEAMELLRQNSICYRGEVVNLLALVQREYRFGTASRDDVDPVFYAERALYFALKELGLNETVDRMLPNMMVRKPLIRKILALPS